MTPRPRPGRDRRSGIAALVLLVAALLGASVHAQQISYTVQVVALSDQDAAVDIVGDLLRQGYPAYVVRSTSPQGAVFRVRVGAFANRPAALLYSETMPQVAGGQPVPALAEGIPTGLTPLAPRLVLARDLAGVDARLLQVGGELVLRTQQRTPLESAEYAILAGGTVEVVRAWQLSEAEDGARLWVRSMPLWPDTWQQDSPEVLEGYKSSLIGLVADRLGLEPAVVEAAQYGATTGVPRLIVVERTAPGTSDPPEVLGLGLPASGMTPAGPLQYLGVDPELLPGLPAGVRLDPAAGTAQGTLPEEPAAGADWTAEADGPFVRLSVPPQDEGGAPTSWRAAVGAPLWSGGGYLVAHVESSVLIYDFLPRR